MRKLARYVTGSKQLNKCISRLGADWRGPRTVATDVVHLVYWTLDRLGTGGRHAEHGDDTHAG